MKPTRSFALLALSFALALAACNGDDPVAPAGTIALDPTAVAFIGAPGQPNPAARQVAITNTGGGTLTGLTATVTHGAGQPTGWLDASLSATTAPATLTLTPTTGTLEPGEYTATVNVASPGATNSPRPVNVTFTVGEEGSIVHTFQYTPPAGAPAVNSIHVPGAHNDWNENGSPMTMVGNAWQVAVLLGPGTNEYKFRINGDWVGNMCDNETWGHAPNNWVDVNADGCIDDGFGGQNAFIEVP